VRDEELTEKKVFVRKATGLVREIGFITAILIVMCNMIGLGWQKRLFQFTGPAIVPENGYFLGIPPIVMAFIIVGIIVLFTVWVFAILGAAMPRSGGGYVYISRILNPSLGFLASWTEFFSIAVSYGLIGTAVFEAILIYAKLAQVSSDIVNALATPEVLLVGGMIIVILFALLASMGVRMAGLLLQIMFWIPAAITVVIYGMLLAVTPQALNSGIQSFTGQTPTAFTQLALSQGMDTPYAGGYWSAVPYAALGAYWAYIGFAASTFVAGEIKEVAKNLPRTLFIANGLVVLLYITISALVARAAMMVGQVTVAATGNTYSFFSAYSFMSYNSAGTLPSVLPKAWMPNIAAFIAMGNGLNWLPILVVIFAVFWVANDIPPFILTSSRIVFAMAFDRVLPEKLAEVNERWHSPIWAVIFCMLVAFIGNFAESDVFVKWFGSGHILTRFINSGGGVVATDIWDTIFFLLAAIAGLMFVYRRKDIYERSSYKPSLGGIPAVTIIGLIATIGNIWMLYAVVAPPSGYGITYPEVWYFTIILLVIGAIIYYYYRSKGSRTGVDYGTIYTEIPPE
jgi:amino acid transporter